MFCSKCGANLPEDAIVCYRCVNPINLNFKNQPQQVQPLGQNSQPQIHKIVVENPRPIVVKNRSDIGAAIVLLALLGGCFYWYLHNKEHEYFGVKITDKGISVSSDGTKSSWNYPTSSNNQGSNSSSSTDTERQILSSSSTSNNTVTCQIANAEQNVYGREYCDTQDCDTDPSTATYAIDVGDSVTLTGSRVSSSLSNVGSWIEVIAQDETRLFIAETKLACPD